MSNRAPQKDSDRVWASASQALQSRRMPIETLRETLQMQLCLHVLEADGAPRDGGTIQVPAWAAVQIADALSRCRHQKGRKPLSLMTSLRYEDTISEAKELRRSLIRNGSKYSEAQNLAAQSVHRTYPHRSLETIRRDLEKRKYTNRTR